MLGGVGVGNEPLVGYTYPVLHLTPSLVVGGNIFYDISASYLFTCGLLPNGSAKCW